MGKAYAQMDWALHVMSTTKIGAPAFVVLVAMLRYRNAEKGTSWPSAETLAERTGMSMSAVKRALRSLRENGVVEAVGNRKATSGNSTREYRFIVSQPGPEVTQAGVQPGPEVTQAEEPQPGSEVTQAESQVGSEVTQAGEPGRVTFDPQPGSEVTHKSGYERTTTPLPVTTESEWLGDTVTWTPRYNPSNESKRKMLRLYPELTVEDQMMLADKAAGRVIETKDARGMSDVLFEAYCRTEANDRRKKAAEAQAAEAMDVETYFGWDKAEYTRRYNEARGITTT